MSARTAYTMTFSLLLVVVLVFTGILVYNEHIESEELELATVYIDEGYSVVIDGIKMASEEIDSAGLHAGAYSVYEINNDERIVYLSRKIRNRMSPMVPVIVPLG